MINIKYNYQHLLKTEFDLKNKDNVFTITFNQLKGKFHLQMDIFIIIYPPHVIPNLYELLMLNMGDNMKSAGN